MDTTLNFEALFWSSLRSALSTPTVHAQPAHVGRTLHMCLRTTANWLPRLSFRPRRESAEISGNQRKSIFHAGVNTETLHKPKGTLHTHSRKEPSSPPEGPHFAHLFEKGAKFAARGGLIPGHHQNDLLSEEVAGAKIRGMLESLRGIFGFHPNEFAQRNSNMSELLFLLQHI